MSARNQLMVTVRRICGGASRLAMDQVPSLPDPAVREAFCSWSSWSWSEAPAQGAPAAGGYAAGAAQAAMMEAGQ